MQIPRKSPLYTLVMPNQTKILTLPYMHILRKLLLYTHVMANQIRNVTLHANIVTLHTFMGRLDKMVTSNANTKEIVILHTLL